MATACAPCGGSSDAERGGIVELRRCFLGRVAWVSTCVGAVLRVAFQRSPCAE